MVDINMAELTAKMKNLQAQIDSLGQLQTAQALAGGPSSYPRVIRNDTVEDILNNPQWKKELEAEFIDSDLGKQAKNYKDVLFMEFCEKQTGKPSLMLDGLRKEAKEKPASKSKKKEEEDNG